MFSLDYNEQGAILRLVDEQQNFFSRLLSKAPAKDLDRLGPRDRDLILAIADLRALGDERPGEAHIQSDRIQLSHAIVASLPSSSAQTIGLPPLVDLTLHTDAEGLPGQSNFRLRYEWRKNGQRQFPAKVGALLETSDGLRRLPLWMMEALEAADGLSGGPNLVEHWSALARFRQALDPGVAVDPALPAARISMTDFLVGLKVKVADRFSITPNATGDDFEIVPFSDETVAEAERENAAPSVTQADLQGADLSAFQRRVHERGALPAYRLEAGSFLVVERSALPALRAVANAQRAPLEIRRDFIRNPRQAITEAVEADLRERGTLDGLTPEAEEEAIEAAAGPLFIETREFSERVKGVRAFEKTLDRFALVSTTWLPERYERRLTEVLAKSSTANIETARQRLDEAIEAGEPGIQVGDLQVPARPEIRELFDEVLTLRKGELAASGGGESIATSGPVVLDVKENFDALNWSPDFSPRATSASPKLPEIVRTPLKPHQVQSFDWQVAVWRAGYPGALNADEPGLGKTLQTLAFLSWLKIHMADPNARERGPILIVAPTSLLENWEQEVNKHLDAPRLGHVIRLYGAATSSRKRSGAHGVDTQSGEAKLDLGFLTEAISEGRAHRFWVLTTYTTLTNYQHSLGKIRFSAAVFDEIQNLKNPDSLRAVAALAMNVDFRIGLTGTPIENSAIDLWAVMDQLIPGPLGALKAFRERFETPDLAVMKDLHTIVFCGNDRPPFALRRLKEEAARDLPAKIRCLRPALMPKDQAEAYEVARLKLAKGGTGAALKMLHHIRAVSVHPAIDSDLDAGAFVNASARLKGTFKILKRIAQLRERCLVFIEHRQMQFRFIELARAEFGLAQIDLINGDTPVLKRQAIVNRFQQHLQHAKGFDILVLGPKAAGVGLTLTAATHVIHLSRWWNPAVEEQCNDRTHRIGQTKDVTIHLPMAVHDAYREHSFDCLLHSLMERKRRLARSALWPMGDAEADVAQLQKIAGLEPPNAAVENPLRLAITEMFKRDDLGTPTFDSDGSVRLS